MYRIATVSYINTYPFIYGLEKSGILKEHEFQLQKIYPSLCSKVFHEKKADIVLMPSGAIKHYDESIIINQNCIGAEGKIRSVMLFSQRPIENVKYIILDYQSTTSVKLFKILAKFHWKKQFEFLSFTENYKERINNNVAGLVIGDRALEMLNQYDYVYDLATEWFNFKQLPFVFAYWVKTKQLDSTFVEKFNLALEWGLKRKNEALEAYLRFDRFLLDYLEKDVCYFFDEKKIEALKLFYELSKKI